MNSYDELLEQSQKLKELLRYAKAYGENISIGNAIIPLDEVKKMLTEVKIKIEYFRSNQTLRMVK